MRTICATLALLCANSAASIDVPYGTDALPALASDAAVIIQAGTAHAADSVTPHGYLFETSIERTITGTVDAERLLVFVVASDTDEVRPVLSGALLFLSPPMTARQLEIWQIQTARPVHQVVGGRSGVVESSVDRLRALEEHLELKGAMEAQIFDWAEKYALKTDTFLQRSAVLQLEEFNENATALRILNRISKSKDVSILNRALAIQSIASAGTEVALKELANVAEDKRIRVTIREISVEATEGLPGADEQLRKWKGSADGVLAGTARRVLAKVE